MSGGKTLLLCSKLLVYASSSASDSESEIREGGSESGVRSGSSNGGVIHLPSGDNVLDHVAKEGECQMGMDVEKRVAEGNEQWQVEGDE